MSYFCRIYMKKSPASLKRGGRARMSGKSYSMPWAMVSATSV